MTVILIIGLVLFILVGIVVFFSVKSNGAVPQEDSGEE
jgi:flagellar basal body-associated protein FliL